jgi:Ca-activated chloride channel family protein
VPIVDEKKKGIIILLTDGQNNRGEKTPSEGAAIASANGVPCYTIGIGGEGYIMQDTPAGPQAVGLPVDIDERTLSDIARKTGGQYYRVDKLEDLSALYQAIAKRETSKLDQTRTQKVELALEKGLVLLVCVLFLAVPTRYTLLRRRDS